MDADGRLDIVAGFASATGPRPDNQDFGAVDLGTATGRATQGIVAAVADGVGGAMGGRIAAELAVRSFIDGYRSGDPLAGIAAAATAAMRGYNRWLHGTGRTDPAMRGAATTFTGLILRGRTATIVHVGDSRAWHYRDMVLTALTDDHVLPQPDLNHVLYRAVGIEPDLRLDIRTVALAPHDRILLTTDGVHGTVPARTLARLLAHRGGADADAAAIVAAAGQGGTRDNATAILIDIIAVPAIDIDLIGAEAARLPIGPVPAGGEIVDGFRLGPVLSDGRYTRLFRSEDAQGAPVVLKFPKPALLSETGARAAFLRESFIGGRIDHPHVGSTIAVDPDRQTRLYIAMPFYEGETLEMRIVRGPMSVAQGVAIAIRLARGIAALHRRGIAHRDIKPDNVILSGDGGLKLIDLGVAAIPRAADFAEAETPGTPGFLAPELYDGGTAGARSDQFALGVTLYRLFTGRYPYGEVEAFQRPRFGIPVPLARWRDDVPAWLDAAILRMVAPAPGDRFDDVEAVVAALASGSTRAMARPRALPLLERDPVRFWQGVALLLAIALIAALATR